MSHISFPVLKLILFIARSPCWYPRGRNQHCHYSEERERSCEGNMRKQDCQEDFFHRFHRCCETPLRNGCNDTEKAWYLLDFARKHSNDIGRVTLEAGGNAPFIVFDDANIDEAVAGAIASKFRGSGQTCVCANRIYVHSSIYADFASRLSEKVAAFKVGNGLEEST
jgi:hypothetical protein